MGLNALIYNIALDWSACPFETLIVWKSIYIGIGSRNAACPIDFN